jgi:hypothetical protein
LLERTVKPVFEIITNKISCQEEQEIFRKFSGRFNSEGENPFNNEFTIYAEPHGLANDKFGVLD